MIQIMAKVIGLAPIHKYKFVTDSLANCSLTKLGLYLHGWDNWIRTNDIAINSRMF